jgi:membrane protein
MPQFLGRAIILVKDTLREWRDDNSASVAASLAYYAIFSLSPTLIVLAVSVGIVIDRGTVEQEIISGLQRTVGSDAAETINQVIEENTREESDLLGTVVWFAVSIWGASGLFTQLQKAMNRIWEVRPMPRRPLVAFAINRMLSLSVILVAGLLLLATLVMNTGVNIVIREVESYADMVFLIRPLQFVITIFMMTVLFMLLFAILPDVIIRWQDVMVGAILTAFLFFLGQFMLGIYLANANIGSAFGAAGSLTVILVWIYYSAQIFLFGAQFTEVWARRYGAFIRPSQGSDWRNITQTQEELRHVGIAFPESDPDASDDIS